MCVTGTRAYSSGKAKHRIQCAYLSMLGQQPKWGCPTSAKWQVSLPQLVGNLKCVTQPQKKKQRINPLSCQNPGRDSLESQNFWHAKSLFVHIHKRVLTSNQFERFCVALLLSKRWSGLLRKRWTHSNGQKRLLTHPSGSVIVATAEFS